jgi:peptide/nickel transport system permease protein
MTEAPLVSVAPQARRRAQERQWLRTFGRACTTHRGAIGLGLAGSVVIVAVVGPFVEPFSPTTFVTTPFAAPSSSHLLGGDVLGRDVLSRVLAGGWVVLLMSLAATVLGVGIGAALGIAAAYFDDWRDGLIMRTVDILLAFPSLVLALLLVSLIGAKLWLIVLAVALSHAPSVARVMRSATLDVTERAFVKAASLQGVKPITLMTQEILPNVVTPLTVESGLRFTYSIVYIAGLAFLGFGQAPPAANWGVMINENRLGLESNPWGVIVPATVIALLTIGCNLFTDAVARVTIGVERGDSAAFGQLELEAMSGELGSS